MFWVDISPLRLANFIMNLQKLPTVTGWFYCLYQVQQFLFIRKPNGGENGVVISNLINMTL